MKRTTLRAADENAVLLLVPRLPGRQDAALSRFIAALASIRPVDVLPAGPSEADRIAIGRIGGNLALLGSNGAEAAARGRAAAAKKTFAVVVAVDDESTRVAAEDLRQRTRAPLVLVYLGNDRSRGRIAAPLSGSEFSARRVERERAARSTCQATDIWAFGPAAPDDWSELARCPTPEPSWMARRLKSLGRPRRVAGLTSIIIPCFNGIRYTRECLDAVARHTSTPHEIILVDNASTDGTAQLARGRRGIQVIRNTVNRGFGAAINQGMKAARGKYLVWLNNDVVVTAGWLDGMIACAERAPWIGAVGPCTNRTVGVQRVRTPVFKTDRELDLFAHAWSLRHQGETRGVQRLTGFCLLVKRSAVRRIGPLDERFGVGTYEEFDYCLRLRQAGYDLAVAQDVFVRHHGHKTFSGFNAMAARARINREIFLDKWCGLALGFLDELNPEAELVHGR